MTIHYDFRQGQRIFVILKSGQKIIAQYVGKTHNHLLLSSGYLPWKDIRSVTVYKGKGGRK